jgi:hypothetical protein|tara:strand:- start:366 stop:752 length:387 start_codon:yes stop_codon:yes gene_type:complete
MLFGDSAWAGVAYCDQAAEVPYVSVTVTATNTPLTLAVNGDGAVTANCDITATNVPVTVSINDVAVTVVVTVTVSGSDLQVDLNDVIVSAGAGFTVSGNELTVELNTQEAIGWTPVDTSNTTTWTDTR